MSVRSSLLYILAILCFANLASAQTTSLNQEQGFSITLPAGWKQLEQREDFPNTFFRASSPAGVDAAAVYVNIFKKGGYSPESYRQAVRRYVSTTMKGQVTFEAEVRVDEQDAWQVEYEGVSVGFSGERRYFLNLVLFHDERIFVVHGTADQSSWPTMKESFAQIGSTLRVK